MQLFPSDALVAEDMDITETIITLLVSIILSCVLCFTYKQANNKMDYNKRFNITLMMIGFITTVLMSIIRTNLMLSVGMLGALSIVRFRTNIKDTRDIGYIFWALCIGITTAVGNYTMGTLTTIFMCIFMLITNRSVRNLSFLLVVRGFQVNINKVDNLLTSEGITYKIKSKSILQHSFELVYEIKGEKGSDNVVLQNLLLIDGIDSVNILTPTTEVI